MDEWLNELMNWCNACINLLMDEWMNAWMNWMKWNEKMKGMDEWMNEINEWMKCMN